MNTPHLSQSRKHKTTSLKREEGGNFVDFYESLQLSPNADAATIERVFRLLAQRFHTNNQETW